MKLFFLFSFVVSFSINVWGSEDSFESYLNDLKRLHLAQQEEKELITYQSKQGQLLKSVFSEVRIDSLYQEFGVDLQFGADVMNIYGEFFSDYERAFYAGDGQFDEVYLDGLGVLFSVTYANAIRSLSERPEDEPDSAKRNLLKSMTRLNVSLAKFAPSQLRMQIEDSSYRNDFIPVAKIRLSKWRKKLDIAGIEL
tara:strand:- start:584 stop:1171 length:588 start_codon:yes stop_codon:yes gene_type:complete